MAGAAISTAVICGDVTHERLVSSEREPGNWLNHHGNYEAHRFVALNKTDGTKIWEVQVADPGQGEVITGAPLIVKDMVVTGMAGAEFGVRGWLEAMDLKTGKRRWRTYTIPGPGEPGHETWKDTHGAWKTGGGTTWVTGSYDPELNLIVWISGQGFADETTPCSLASPRLPVGKACPVSQHPRGPWLVSFFSPAR